MVAVSSAAPGSSTAVTVTVWAVFQVSAVNVSDAVDTDAAPGSSEATPTVTSAAGWVDKATVNVAVSPSPTSSVSGSTTRPASSSSSTATATVSLGRVR